jgi:hypothetical protein
VKSLRSLHVTKAEFQQSTGCRLCPHTRCRSDGSKLPARCWGPARQRPEPTREAEQLFGYDRDRHERPGQVRYASRQRARIQAARRGAAIRAILKSQVERQWSSMAEHKFKIGERVYFNSRSRREVPPGPCQIVKRLPAANGEFQYIVRSEYKDHQHVAKEGELSRY